jgi:PAS domain-containing protein
MEGNADIIPLRNLEAGKAAILESALDCIVSIDGAGLVVEWNPAAEKTFGWPRDEAVGRLLADLIVPPKLCESHLHIVGEMIVNALERRRAEAELRAGQERFRAVVENSTDALLIHDAAGRIVQANQRACNSLGYTCDELLALNIADGRCPARRERSWTRRGLLR